MTTTDDCETIHFHGSYLHIPSPTKESGSHNGRPTLLWFRGVVCRLCLAVVPLKNLPWAGRRPPKPNPSTTNLTSFTSTPSSLVDEPSPRLLPSLVHASVYWLRSLSNIAAFSIPSLFLLVISCIRCSCDRRNSSFGTLFVPRNCYPQRIPGATLAPLPVAICAYHNLHPAIPDRPSVYHFDSR